VTNGPTKSQHSKTMRSGCQAFAAAKACSNVRSTLVPAKNSATTSGRGSVVGSAPHRRLTSANKTSGIGPADNSSIPVSSCEDNGLAVNTAASWPRSRAARASGNSGSRCPRAGVAKNRIRIRCYSLQREVADV